MNYKSISMALAVTVAAMAGYIVYLHGKAAPARTPELAGAAGASSQQTGFPVAHLNDGTPAAWGSDESLTDVFAYIVLERPEAISRLRLAAFSPEGRNHLRDVRLVAAASVPADNREWKMVGFSAAVGGVRTGGERTDAEMVTVPPVADEEQVMLMPDKASSGYGAYRVWGVACLRSRGDVCNRLEAAGNGMYLREIRLEK